MKIFNKKSIKEINEAKKEIEDRKNAINNLGAELSQEKLKNMQKDAVISNLGQEVSKLKLDVMQIKGGK